MEDATRNGIQAMRAPIADLREWMIGPDDLPTKPQPALAAEQRPPAPFPAIVASQRIEPIAPQIDGRVALRRPAATTTTIHPIMQVGAIEDGGSRPIRARVATVRVAQTD
jgi:hypothetical protein